MLKDLIARRLSICPICPWTVNIFTFFSGTTTPTSIKLDKIKRILGRRGFTFSQMKDNSILVRKLLDNDIF